MPSERLRKAGVSNKTFDSCVRKVRAKGTGNPFAICEASLQKSRGLRPRRKSRREVRSRR